MIQHKLYIINKYITWYKYKKKLVTDLICKKTAVVVPITGILDEMATSERRHTGHAQTRIYIYIYYI